LAYKCLEVCQALVAKGEPFKFSLSMGATLTFSLDTRGKEETPTPMARKKVSPSTMRRNARRKEAFLEKKAETSSNTATKGSWRSEVVAENDKSVKLKLKRNPSENVNQLDGHEEEVTTDVGVQTDEKPAVKHMAVQTIKSVPALNIQKCEETNISGLPGMSTEEANVGSYRAPKANVGPYRAPTTNMGPYQPPHNRGYK